MNECYPKFFTQSHTVLHSHQMSVNMLADSVEKYKKKLMSCTILFWDQESISRNLGQTFFASYILFDSTSPSVVQTRVVRILLSTRTRSRSPFATQNNAAPNLAPILCPTQPTGNSIGHLENVTVKTNFVGKSWGVEGPSQSSLPFRKTRLRPPPAPPPRSLIERFDE